MMMRKKPMPSLSAGLSGSNSTMGVAPPGLGSGPVARTNSQLKKNRNPNYGMLMLLGIMVAAGACYRVYSSYRSTASLTEPSSDSSGIQKGGIKAPSSTLHSSPYTYTTVDSVRQAFYERYGGEKEAMLIYKRGILPYGSVTATAHRLLRLVAQNQESKSKTSPEPLVLSFGGYSVTVGRGNFYHQSYPMVLRDLLSSVLQHELQLSLIVRNAAIGGIPSFPYGFCLPHFLGDTADLISWDYSMNEQGGNAAILEAYLRHASMLTTISASTSISTQPATRTKPPPMVLVLDTNANRCNLLQKYVTGGFLTDALCVGMAKDALSDYAKFVESSKTDSPASKSLPLGLQHWHDFGAPPTCPGRSNWHPKYQEHALIGWMIGMYFMDAIDEAKRIVKDDKHWQDALSRTMTTNAMDFAPPLEKVPDHNAADVTNLLYGHALSDEAYRLSTVSCRTSFLPATEPDRDIVSIVVSGLTSTSANTAASILTPRTNADYSAGWVLDVSTVERDTKLKVEQCGGLGYVDMKIALYGVPESGPLRLWLPLLKEHGRQDDATTEQQQQHDDLDATHWLSELIVCEANEKRPKTACQLNVDVAYTVGGVKVPTENVQWIRGAAEYLKRPTCVHIGIPKGATVTPLSNLQSTATTATSKPVSSTVRQRLLKGLLSNKGKEDDNRMGLVVDINVKPERVTRDNGACCISHVVWEER